jgi:hypothetical protein
MGHIFISYARKDINAEDGVVRRLVARLRRNFNIWLDKTGITAGTNWQNALEDAVKSGNALVFILSPNSVGSDWCKAEIQAARNAKIPIVPYVYQKADFPFGMDHINALFHDDDPQAAEKLETALRELAPSAYIHTESPLITKNLLNNREVTFAQAAEQISDPKRFFLSIEDEEVELLGLPLLPTSFCRTYLLGRVDDTLAYKPCIQLALQFSGSYESADFPVRIAQHFLAQDRNFPLRMLLVCGPAQITYDERRNSNSLSYMLDIPTDDENQWSDALHATHSALKFLHKDRQNPALQIFVQGPVAGITYELGAEHRGLLYKTEHYQYDRDSQKYYRVLGNIE